VTPTDLPLTVPVESIVKGALRALEEVNGLDRDEAYLLARLERGESLAAQIVEPENL
jgi:hypothetical protein